MIKNIWLRIQAIFYLLIFKVNPEDTQLGYKLRITHDKLKKEIESNPDLLLHLAFLFCNFANESNAGELNMSMKDVSFKGKNIGDWKILIQKETKE